MTNLTSLSLILVRNYSIELYFSIIFRSVKRVGTSSIKKILAELILLLYNILDFVIKTFRII